MKTGLVLEGGAMRGMFTAGVMDVLMENGVNFDEQQLFIVRRRDMSLLSDYFRRDARRYDNGFELY